MKMDADRASNIHGTLKLILQVAGAVIPILIVTYLGKEVLLQVQDKQAEANTFVYEGPSDEERTRAILFEDLDDAWADYESGEYSADMWDGVLAHVTRNWNEQAMAQGWDELGWEPPSSKKDKSLAQALFDSN